MWANRSVLQLGALLRWIQQLASGVSSNLRCQLSQTQHTLKTKKFKNKLKLAPRIWLQSKNSQMASYILLEEMRNRKRRISQLRRSKESRANLKKKNKSNQSILQLVLIDLRLKKNPKDFISNRIKPLLSPRWKEKQKSLFCLLMISTCLIMRCNCNLNP